MVVTGNKALLAEHGREIFEAAAAHKVPVFFEAAAAGGSVPIITRRSSARRLSPITSFRCTGSSMARAITSSPRMTESGMGFEEALREAQAAGFAEADPTLDVNGWGRRAHKAIILASLAYGFWVGTEKVYVEGIEKITAKRTSGLVAQLGYTIKLLAIIKAGKAERDRGAGASALIPQDHDAGLGKGVSSTPSWCRATWWARQLFYGRGAVAGSDFQRSYQ